MWLLLGGDSAAVEKQKEDRDLLRHLPRRGPAAVCAWAPGAWSVYKSPQTSVQGLCPLPHCRTEVAKGAGPCSAENGAMRQEGAGVCPQPPAKLTKGSTSAQAWA